MRVTVADVVSAIEARFPPVRAEAWDRVGLLAGDPDREVTGVTLGLDPTVAALAEAAAAGDNVLVTHHPAFLEPPIDLKPGPESSGVLFSAIDAGIALINAHTNLDRDPRGQRLLPEALGLEPITPLETAPGPMVLVTVYVPPESASAVTAAMSEAGAGRIGDYAGCSFSTSGTGRFTPADTSSPAIGTPGLPAESNELRVEMVCPPAASRRVAAAATGVHPYEEPLVTLTPVTIARNAARLGMVSRAPVAMPLSALAVLAAGTFNVTPRVWGDPDRMVDTVATATGSAGSLIGDARRAGAQALVAGEVRYHDALDAAENGLAIVELGHDVSEWPLVTLLEEAVRSVPGLQPDQVHRLRATPGWWTS